ncbi:RING-H2 finger protein ATL16-like [Malania oleifera]|uniref:RING-H2 finger protein ATL16-like n=1 Tax=Malania oleifera TaxID=397392 RepID=UPI0025ADE109|nr:RING-H2 finger protein ATL16-like [Malania oleifera]
MNPVHTHLYNHGSEAVSLLRNQQNPIYQSPLDPPGNGFPILAIVVLGILATAFLLMSYYVFVMKCCLNWQQVDLLSQFSISQTRRSEDPLMDYSPVTQNRGLNDTLIRDIPTFQFKRRESEDHRSFFGCVVCLNEFQEQEMLRVLPSCGHAFHLDCIDIWLQGSANCPLCRSSISGATRLPFDRIIAPTSSPQDSQLFVDSLMGSDEDFVVIELSGEDGEVMLPNRRQERGESRELMALSRSCSRRKLEHKLGSIKQRRLHHVSSMGDECIDIRDKDDQFSIQPIRRSFSLGSAADRQLYLSVQETIRHEYNKSEECSSRAQMSCFSFGHGRARGSKNAVRPVEF